MPIEKTLMAVLSSVEKPGRYIGGEVNAVVKPFDSASFRMALAFPDTYEIAMSHLGLQILYGLVNSRADALAERVFMPWTDMEAVMRANSIPLFTLETKRPVADFDVLGFSLQYEVCFPTVLYMLDLAGIPRRRDDRLAAARAGKRFPLVIAGGPCAFNPEPISDFLDLVFVGDGEDTLPALVDVWNAHRAEGPDAVIVAAARSIPGVYAPGLYETASGAARPTVPGLPATVESATVRDLDAAYFPTAPVIPFVQAVHERISLEIMRGCGRGCRFCQAGMTKRPTRPRGVEKLVEIAKESYARTGFDEISLLSLATGDYPHLADLCRRLMHHFSPLAVGLSFPSLRADTALLSIPEIMTEVRKGAITVAAEAGSERLRGVINKDITEDGILRGLEAAFRQGWNRVKLYFMAGLPTEELADIAAIGDLVDKVLAVGRRVRAFPHIACSVAPFVPKPGTPFQWEPMASRKYLQDARRMLYDRFKSNGAVKVSFHEIERSLLEGALARGGRELNSVIDRAATLGCRLDAWDETFDYSKWHEAFASAGLDIQDYACRALPLDEQPAWGHISPGVSTEFLRRELVLSRQALITPDCRISTCHACGLQAVCRPA